MHYTSLIPTFLLFLMSASAFPISKRALTFRAYNTMSISSTPAGNAASEATAVWADGLDLSDLTAISKEDLDILSVERSNAEDAEVEAFNPAIEVDPENTALQCGKIKNKVLKLTGLVQIDQIKLAQAQAAGDDTAEIEASLADEQGKLTTNIALDEEAAGQECEAVDFVGESA